jgi:hypothetical protein
MEIKHSLTDEKQLAKVTLSCFAVRKLGEGREQENCHQGDLQGQGDSGKAETGVKRQQYPLFQLL